MNLWNKYYRAGKQLASVYYLKGYLFRLIPHRVLALYRKWLLKGWEKRPDADYLRWRRDVYCQLTEPFEIPGEYRATVGLVTPYYFHSRYAIDAWRWLRCWPSKTRLSFKDGDVRKNPPSPTLIKARRLDDSAPENAVVLNLDSARHFMRPKDSVPFRNKKPQLLFRGDIYDKPDRIRFFEQWADHPLFDLGDTNRSHPSKWSTPFISVAEHFEYQFILALEGYDMSSALQWIMASNCVPVMPRPRVEGWLMHSQLQPGVHYIEIAPDFSDVGKKIQYYTEHPEEAERISQESKKWAQQFYDRRREYLISLLVIDKYLSLTKK